MHHPRVLLFVPPCLRAPVPSHLTMPRFTFRLQRVLELRQRTEDEHRRRVAAIEAERAAAEERLRSIQATITASRAEQRAMLAASAATESRGLNMTALRTHTGALMGLTAQAHRTALELAGILKRLEAARALLAKASADRKAVELLRERAYEQWKQEQSRREIMHLDEIGATAYTRAAASEE